MAKKYFEGTEGFLWWRGVVEDRKDPLQCGRCKVRIFGHHTEDKQEMPTEDLPWCRPLIPLDSGRENSVGPMEGTWVIGFFADGEHKQFPYMFARISGFPEKEADPSIGFNDPRPDSILEGHQVPREPQELHQHDDGSGNDIVEQPKKSRFPDKNYLPEPATSRYARGRDGGNIDKTIVPLKEANVEIGQTDVPTGAHPAGTGTDISSPATEWTEEKTHYNTKYPYNHVYFSESGHILEFDDTPGFERLHLYHRVGSFFEINEVGCKVEKIVDHHYDIVLRSRYTHIEASHEHTTDWYSKEYVNKDGMAGFNKDVTVGPGGSYNVTLEDGKLNFYVNGDCNLYTTGSVYVETDENVVAMVHKELHATVDKSAYLTVKENLNAHVLQDANIQVDGNLRSKVGKDCIEHVGANKTQVIGGDYKLMVLGGIEIYSAQSFKQAAGGNIEHSALGAILNQSATQISNTATTMVANTAPLVQNNALLTSCTGDLLGATIDDDGDVTLPGPPVPGDVPNLLPTAIITTISTIADAIIVDITEQNAPDLIEAALDSIMTMAEAAAEADNAAIAANPAAPGSRSGGGGGGPKGPSIFIDGPGGFLWKPEGENSGVITVLIPGDGGVTIYRAIPDGEDVVVTNNEDGTQTTSKVPRYKKGERLEDLKFHATFGDGRSIYRGSKPGAGYGPEPVIVSAGGKDYTIEKPAMRHD